MRLLAASGPVPVLAAPEAGADLVTELVAGEIVEVSGGSGGFYGALVPDHATSLDPRGYPGWVPRNAPLVSAEEWRPDLVVCGPNRAGLPLGALVRGQDGVARLPGEEKVRLGKGSLLAVGESVGGNGIRLSRDLIGLPYKWGGTDSTTGMDCSGMVYRVMRLLGVRVPRDADDQFDYAPFSSREGWENAREGDLVFFGEESVTHVGFYLGGGEYISEHGSGGAVVRAMTEDAYRGFARYI